MAIEVEIPFNLRPLTDNRVSVEANGSSVLEVMTDLVRTFPALQGKLFNAQGELRVMYSYSVGDEDVRYLNGMDTQVGEGDRVSIILAVA